MTEFSPMMKQYFDIKDKYKDYILFFRLGDFYEMFFEDAKLVSKELELTLTGRECGQQERAPMCGVPYHSYETYVSRLIDKGYKVAICEQVETPNIAKGIVKRDVVRIITPGTIIESSMLDDDKNNFIASIYQEKNNVGICFSDISTGEIFITDIIGFETERKIINELSSFMPREILANSEFAKNKIVKRFIKDKMFCVIDILDDEQFITNKVIEKILSHFNKNSISEVGFDNENQLSIKALGALIEYFNFTYKTAVKNLIMLNFYQDNQYMNIDMSAKSSLEITENLKTKDKRKSLLGILDKTKTPMGKRMIRKYIEQPLINTAVINKRLEAVNELVNNPIKRIELADGLSGIFDLERLLTRIIFKTITPRELKSMGYTIEQIPKVKNFLKTFKSLHINELNKDIDELSGVLKLINDSIVDEPPAVLKDGGIIKDGFNNRVDEYRDIINNSKKYLAQIEYEQKQKTGIKNLKISYNKVFGYFIEVTKSFIDKVPETYIRKQTLANCERYIIQELKELEEKILVADEKLIKLESEIYDKIIEMIADYMVKIQKTALSISHIDVLCSFANVATKNNYCMPLVDNSDVIDIKDGRHPIVESVLIDMPFVCNDTYINSLENKISIITGPNMAGKSTYMRQVALIVLMAQIGSFVPAKSAHIGIVDGIFTRIGASDDLSSGQSTFMVEMTEVSYILKNMTKKSLIILDEIGRGTSTYDGMSIAGAIIQHIASENNNGGKTLFATHYHELADMPNRFNNMKNYSIAVRKNGDDIVFLHRIIAESADRSYGLEVSKLAGIPDEIIKCAKDILIKLENQDGKTQSVSDIDRSDYQISTDNCYLSMIEEIKKIDPEIISPLEALNYIYRLKSMI